MYNQVIISIDPDERALPYPSAPVLMSDKNAAIQTVKLTMLAR